MFDVGDRIIGLELPDTFYKLAELLEQDQFELLLSKNRINLRSTLVFQSPANLQPFYGHCHLNSTPQPPGGTFISEVQV